MDIATITDGASSSDNQPKDRDNLFHGKDR